MRFEVVEQDGDYPLWLWPGAALLEWVESLR